MEAAAAQLDVSQSTAMIFIYVIVVMIGWFMWRAYVHPSHVLGRQAAKMGWHVVGSVSAPDGSSNVHLARGSAEAFISFTHGHVVLLSPKRAGTFSDFVAVDRELALPENTSTVNASVRAVQVAMREIGASGLVPNLDLVSEAALSLTNDTERTEASLQEDGLTSHGLAFLLISNVAHDELCSGSHHVYRGVLSMRGQQLLAVFTAASEGMIREGMQDRSKHEADLGDLRTEVKRVG